MSRECVGENDHNIVRAMAIDVGERRIGLAISDATRTLARPLKTLEIAGAEDGLRRVVAEIARLADEDDSLSTIVVGLPVRLDGSPNEQTSRVTAFVSTLREHAGADCDRRRAADERRGGEPASDWHQGLAQAEDEAGRGGGRGDPAGLSRH